MPTKMDGTESVSVLLAALQSGTEPNRDPVETGQVLLTPFRWAERSELLSEVETLMKGFGTAFTINFV